MIGVGPHTKIGLLLAEACMGRVRYRAGGSSRNAKTRLLGAY